MNFSTNSEVTTEQQPTQRKLYTGLINVQLLAVNPTKEEAKEILKYDSKLYLTNLEKKFIGDFNGVKTKNFNFFYKDSNDNHNFFTITIYNEQAKNYDKTEKFFIASKGVSFKAQNIEDAKKLCSTNEKYGFNPKICYSGEAQFYNLIDCFTKPNKKQFSKDDTILLDNDIFTAKADEELNTFIKQNQSENKFFAGVVLGINEAGYQTVVIPSYLSECFFRFPKISKEITDKNALAYMDLEDYEAKKLFASKIGAYAGIDLYKIQAYFKYAENKKIKIQSKSLKLMEYMPNEETKKFFEGGLMKLETPKVETTKVENTESSDLPF